MTSTVTQPAGNVQQVSVPSSEAESRRAENVQAFFRAGCDTVERRSRPVRTTKRDELLSIFQGNTEMLDVAIAEKEMVGR